MRYFLISIFCLITLFSNGQSKWIIGISGGGSAGYEDSYHSSYDYGYGYNVHLGLNIGNSGIGFGLQGGKTLFASNRYDTYIPGYFDAWGIESYYVNHIGGTIRWTLPKGRVRPYFQGQIGNNTFRYKDKVKVKDWEWNYVTEDWEEVTEVYDTYRYKFGSAYTIGYSGGLLIKIMDGTMLDLQYANNVNQDVINGSSYYPSYRTSSFHIGLTFEIGNGE